MPVPADLPVGSGLPAALEVELAGSSAAGLAGAVNRLMTTYRSQQQPSSPVLATERDVAAYAAYRMPATHAAVRAALQQITTCLPGFSPRSVVDVGAGTGAASWGVAELLPVETITVLEQSEAAIDFGRRLAVASPSAALRGADWRSWRLARGAEVELPETDLLVAAYVLAELHAGLRQRLVAAACERAGAVLLIEPGTPQGYEHILAARRQLMAAGMTLIAPCPHELECPLAGRDDWCHFSVRVQRSALHRRLKDAHVGHEDEKFSFVAAVRGAVPRRPAARVLRHPAIRKGLVSLELCRDDGTADSRLVSKSQDDYRLARKTSWGDEWPPPGDPG